MKLVFNRIKTGYDKLCPILDLSDKVYTLENSVIGLAGLSGVGKTTLLDSISKNIDLLSGEIEFGSEEQDFKVSYIKQDSFIFPHLTVREIFEMLKTSSSLSYREILKRFRVSDTMNKKQHQLSGGQLKRVVLALGVYNNPDLLIMDEPFNNIDKYHRDIIMMDLKMYLKENQIMTIISTHDKYELEYLTDKIILIGGKDKLEIDSYANFQMSADPDVLKVFNKGVELNGELLSLDQVEVIPFKGEAQLYKLCEVVSIQDYNYFILQDERDNFIQIKMSYKDNFNIGDDVTIKRI